MMSLRARLGLGLLAVLALVFALLGWLFTTATRHIAEDYVAGRLDHDMDQILLSMTPDASGVLRPDPARLDAVYHALFSGHYYRISVGNEVYRSRSLWDGDLPASVADGTGATRTHVAGPQGQSLLLITRRFVKHDQPLVIAVAEDLTPIEARVAQYARRYAGLALLVAIVIVVFQLALVQLGLRPLSRIRRDLERIERGDDVQLDARVPRELGPVVRQLNVLMQTLGDRLRRSRGALANLAHAMKTPLTTLASLSDDTGMSTETRDTLVRETDTLRRLIDRELSRARLAGGPASGQQTDLATELPRLVQALRAMHDDKALDISWTLPTRTLLPLDREDMLELLGNLLDNACKWARSRVALDIHSDGDLTICVQDDGPGVAEQDLPALAQRGVRLDETTAGHGLGLAIVNDIVSAYGGRIELGHATALGGLRVDVSLPLGDRAAAGATRE